MSILDYLSTEVIKKASATFVSWLGSELESIVERAKQGTRLSKRAEFDALIEKIGEEPRFVLSGISSDNLTTSMEKHLERVLKWSDSIYFKEMMDARRVSSYYIPMSTYLIPRRLQRSSDEVRNRILLDEVLIERSDNIIILGGAGGGKTTSLKHFCQIAKARAEAKMSPVQSIVLIRFRDISDYADSTKIVSRSIFKELGLTLDVNPHIAELPGNTYLTEFKDAAAFSFLAILNDLGVVLLLDGLDEASSFDGKEKVVSELTQISNRYPRLRIVLTCRTGELKRPPEGFMEYEISPLTEPQVQDFCNVWLGDRITALKFVNDIKLRGYLDAALRPINLAYMCSIFQRTGSVERTPRDLFSKISDILIDEWDEDRFIVRDRLGSKFNKSRKREFLEHIGYHCSFVAGKASMTTGEMRSTISWAKNDFRLSGAQIIEVLNSIEEHTSIFVQSGADRYEFSHKTLQEFFAAQFVVKLGYVPKLTTKGGNVANELAMATAMSSDSTAYLGSILKSVFSDEKLVHEMLGLYLKRLTLEEVVLDGERGGFDASFLASSLLAFGPVVLSHSKVFSAWSREFPPMISEDALMRLDSLVEGGWNIFCRDFFSRFVRLDLRGWDEIYGERYQVFKCKKSNHSVLDDGFCIVLSHHIIAEIKQGVRDGHGRLFGS